MAVVLSLSCAVEYWTGCVCVMVVLADGLYIPSILSTPRLRIKLEKLLHKVEEEYHLAFCLAIKEGKASNNNGRARAAFCIMTS